MGAGCAKILLEKFFGGDFVSMDEKVLALRKMIEEAGYIVFFGGAGVSTESNIPDFRSAKGLYSERVGERGLSPETILSHDFFVSHTDEFYGYYKSKMIYRDAKPNDAHLALAKLEGEGKLKAVITQNIDGLHQMAGSREVLELHGSVYRNYCMACGKAFSPDYVLKADGVPRCDNCGGVVRPDVVLYGESLDAGVLERAVRHIEKADLLIVAGTSLTVYPAAGLVRYCRGGKLALINRAPTPYDSFADLVIQGSVGQVLKACVG